jgi:HEAT repeat protein
VAALRRAAADREFSVRAAAYEGLGLATRAEPSVAADLRAALANEPDPFVRRVIARALGGDRSKATALALVAFLRQSLDTGDRQATTAVHEALARLADHDPRRGRAYEAWAQWAAERPERWEDRHGTVEDHSR